MCGLSELLQNHTVPGDRNGDHIISDDELAIAKEDRKSGTISSDELM
jgi:hypothetical protein